MNIYNIFSIIKNMYYVTEVCLYRRINLPIFELTLLWKKMYISRQCSFVANNHTNWQFRCFFLYVVAFVSLITILKKNVFEKELSKLTFHNANRVHNILDGRKSLEFILHLPTLRWHFDVHFCCYSSVVVSTGEGS